MESPSRARRRGGVRPWSVVARGHGPTRGGLQELPPADPAVHVKRNALSPPQELNSGTWVSTTGPSSMAGPPGTRSCHGRRQPGPQPGLGLHQAGHFVGGCHPGEVVVALRLQTQHGSGDGVRRHGMSSWDVLRPGCRAPSSGSTCTRERTTSVHLTTRGRADIRKSLAVGNAGTPLSSIHGGLSRGLSHGCPGDFDMTIGTPRYSFRVRQGLHPIGGRRKVVQPLQRSIQFPEVSGICEENAVPPNQVCILSLKEQPPQVCDG